jgi:hypothetical protein
MIKTEMDPWQHLETDLVEGDDDPLTTERYPLFFYSSRYVLFDSFKGSLTRDVQL